MAKLLAIEWDDREIRAVAGSSANGRISIDQILREPIQSSSGDAPNSSDVARTLTTLVNQHGLKRARTFVSIGRSNVELKELTLPPATDDVLPDLVRFQAMREFNALGEDWQLDFLPLPGDPEQQRVVLAAAISPSNLANYTQVCQTAGLQLDQIVLRPCASATLVDQFAPDTHYRLFVDVLADEIDLTVLAGSTPEFMRTARIYSGDPSAPVDIQRTILLEVRRTLAAVSNKLHGSKIDSLLLCSDGPNQTQLKDLLETELKLPVQLFDPLSKVEIQRNLQANLPSHHSHFAPLVGLLVGGAAERTPLLDFLHPRKKPAPKSNKRQWSLVAGLAAVLVLALLASVASQVWALDAQIAEKNTRIAELSKNTKANEATLKAMKELGEWKVTDFAMVKEFESLLNLLPDAKSLKLTSLNFIANKETGGRFVINGVASSSDVVSKMIRDISAAKAELPHPNPKFKREVSRYVAKQDGLKEDNSNPPYKVSFTATIELQKSNPVAMVVNPAAQAGGKTSVLARTNAPAKTGATKTNSAQSEKQKTSQAKHDAKPASSVTPEKESKSVAKADDPKPDQAETKKSEPKSSSEAEAEKSAPVKSPDPDDAKTEKRTDTKATDDKKPGNAKSEGST